MICGRIDGRHEHREKMKNSRLPTWCSDVQCLQVYNAPEIPERILSTVFSGWIQEILLCDH